MPNLFDKFRRLRNAVAAGYQAMIGLDETVGHGRAEVTIEHRNAKGELLHTETKWNLITNAGRDFLHTQGYGSAGVADGLRFIALSNDTVTETATSTVLSNEIAANGLSRAAATTNTHTTGTNTTTLAKTFTCATAPQAAQKAALFTASSSGTMNHVLGFTQRSLQIGDTLTVTFTITLG